jgi:hypothetical protein
MSAGRAATTFKQLAGNFKAKLSMPWRGVK